MLKGWILTGGRSTRFGADKVVHLVDGVPLVLRVAGVLRAAGVEPGLVGKSPRGVGLPELFEPEAEGHPLYGVARALEEGAGLVTPVDLVDLSVEQVVTLLAAAGRFPAGVHARGQPLLAVLPGGLAARARRIAAAGGSVREFVEGLEAVDLGPLRNLNVLNEDP